MARTLKDEMRADMARVFLNTDEFAEVAIYHPYNGKPRRIAAIIERGDLEAMAGQAVGNAQPITITVANNAESGISRAELDRGKDKIEFEVVSGVRMEMRMLKDLIEEDDVALTFRVL